MPGFEDSLDFERARRAREIGNARTLLNVATPTLKETASRSLIVLCYAQWEGFFNYCVDEYVKHVNNLGRPIVDINPALLACEIDSALASLRDRNFKIEHRPGFARDVVAALNFSRLEKGTNLLRAASNLDFKRLRIALDALGISEDRFEPNRNFIDHELVAWRHQVAHGSEPDLTRADLIKHATRASDLLLDLSQAFQDKLLSL